MIASVKAWTSERTREVARLGREMMGGNGIITDNYCIKAVNDAEVLYTYEVIKMFVNLKREHMILIA
jgi:alkylation response protein AidB-like acyl-CoA dehydrogenase